MNDSQSPNQKRESIKRINSQAIIPPLEDKEKLPSMSVDAYLSMMEKFLADNSEFLNYDAWMKFLRQKSDGIDQNLTNAMKRFPATKVEGSGSLEGTTIADFSCPNMVASALTRMSKDGITTPEDPRFLSEEIALNKKHLLWILSYFDSHLKMIQKHEAYEDSAYDSGLSDEDIDLLLKLIVGKQRVFRTDTLSEIENKKFIDLGMKVMLKNATGFQRAISLLIVSIFNYDDKNELDHIDVHFLKGEKGSYKQYKDVYISESDSCSLDESLFHEITHSFHSMLGLAFGTEEIFSNIAIMNSPNINLIDQFFPMLRPAVMFPIIEKIKDIIDKYYGKDFEKTDKEGREKLVVLILEPMFRNIVVSGFGNLIYPDYNANTAQSLKVTEATLTSENMARCLYLSMILNDSLLNPKLDDSGRIIIPTNTVTYKNKESISHPQFNDLSVVPVFNEKNMELSDLFGIDGLWNTAGEKLDMQGSVLYQTKIGKIYVQDRQHEQIYLVRSGKHDVSIPILYRHRFHQNEDRDQILRRRFKLMSQLIPASADVLKEDFYGLTLNSSYNSIFTPPLEEKYTVSGKPIQNHNKLKVDEGMFKMWTSAMGVYFESSDEDSALPDSDKIEENSAQQHNDETQENVTLNTEEFDEGAFYSRVKEQVLALIKEGKEINITNSLGQTPLSIAIENNLLEVANLLIRNGADVNVWDNEGNTLMHSFLSYLFTFDPSDESEDPLQEINKEKIDVLKALINSKNRGGLTPLHYAISEEVPAYIIKKLIDSEADVNAIDYDGNTPMHAAAQIAASKAILQLLIDAKADINAINHKKHTPIYGLLQSYCEVDKKIDLLQFMLKNGADINVRDNKGNTILHIVVDLLTQKDIEKILQVLLNNNSDIECLNYIGDTPLSRAVRLNNFNATKFLVEKNAKIEVKDYDGKSPIRLAVSSRFNEIAEYLLNKIDIKSEYAEDAFLSAVSSSNIDIANWLIEKGVNVNAQDTDGNTAIHLAVKNCVEISENPFEFSKESKIRDTEELLKKIVLSGGNLNIKNKAYKIPVDLLLKQDTTSDTEIALLRFQIDLTQNAFQQQFSCRLTIDRNLSIIRELEKLPQSTDDQVNATQNSLIANTQAEITSETKELERLQQSENQLINDIRIWGEQHVRTSVKPGFEPMARLLLQKSIDHIIEETKKKYSQDSEKKAT